MNFLSRQFLALALLGGAATLAQGAPKKVKTVSPLSASFRLPAGRALEKGVVWNEIRLPGADAGVTRLWIYRPTATLSGNGKIPVVFVAPAGTPLFYGMRLGQGDTAEHLPYARAGMMVVAYEIDGAVPENETDEETLIGARLFRSANGGINNARRAINWTLGHVPNVDARRLYVAGHSSAGTLALQVAQNEPRIAACAAYAPATDLETRPSAQAQNYLDSQLPGYSDFLSRISPLNNVARLKCPTLLFHADDDTNVPTADVYRFGQLVYQRNKKLVFSRVATGEHYNSMIQNGIPNAIRWFKSLPIQTANKIRKK
jgi:dipeptidyl aminopeptidase/acylaminoacyl peptidase